jgi:glycosyltransferase involved in cell wall biosynthesis
MTAVNNFTFIVLTYNHANYILEHLESIKYLVVTYGDGISVDVIIADDASRDNTTKLAASWLNKNAGLFRRLTMLSDGINRGTCKNLTRAIACLETDYCKITAGDDVYSFVNIFIEAKKVDGREILSGFPLNLIDGVLTNTRFEIFNIFATNVIYEGSPYLHRLRKINFFYAPCIVYAVPALLDKRVTEFVEGYAVTEDYPLQIRMAELRSPLKFLQVEKVFVYYRRTAGSTYIIKSTAFNKDKTDIFRYLIRTDADRYSKALLENRLFCFNLKSKFLKLFLNLNIYLYCFHLILNVGKILLKFLSFDTELPKHQAHYELIKSQAADFEIEA